MTTTMTRWRVPVLGSLPVDDDNTFYSMGNPNADRHYWRSLPDLKAANAARGHHYFEPRTMRWYGARGGHLCAGAYVEEQVDAPDPLLRWRVTWFDDRADTVTSVGCATRATAHEVAWHVHRNGFDPVRDED